MDLFSFLDDVPIGDDNNDTFIEETEDQSSIPKKRKAIPSAPAASNGEPTDHGAGPSALKKPRMASPKPVVVDEFETEAKREVAASAGLTGGIEDGSRLELRHQVRLLFLYAFLYFLCLYHSRSAIKLLCHQDTIISLFHNMSLLLSPLESINSL